MKFAITERLQEIFLTIQTVSDGTERRRVHALNSQQWWAMKAPGQDGAAEEKAASTEEVEKTKTLPLL